MRTLKVKTDKDTGEQYIDIKELLDHNQKLIDRVKYYKMEVQPDKSIILTLYNKRKRKMKIKL
jgi:hypothetical protein